MSANCEYAMTRLGPQVPGGRYFCSYWRKEYTVLFIDWTTNRDSWLMTVKWEDGRISRHCTAWDKKDQIIYQPEGVSA